jgi:hypothetical protein
MTRADEHAMPAGERRAQELIEKIHRLPADRLADAEDFVDFLRQRQEERRLTKAVTGASEAAFAKVWDNPDDASMTAFESGDIPGRL